MTRVISERTVREAARAGRALELAAGDRVTPAARDLAGELGVALTPTPPAAAGAGRPSAAPPPAGPAVVALGADHGGFALKEALKATITELGFALKDVGCGSTDPVDYPVFAARVAERVARGEARFGIMVDGAGIGSAMVANKIPGARAAPCHDLTTARNAREHTDANLLTLGGGLVGERLAREIVRAFLTTPFAGGRHQRRVAMINALDAEPKATT